MKVHVKPVDNEWQIFENDRLSSNCRSEEDVALILDHTFATADDPDAREDCEILWYDKVGEVVRREPLFKQYSSSVRQEFQQIVIDAVRMRLASRGMFSLCEVAATERTPFQMVVTCTQNSRSRAIEIFDADGYVYLDGSGISYADLRKYDFANNGEELEELLEHLEQELIGCPTC